MSELTSAVFNGHFSSGSGDLHTGVRRGEGHAQSLVSLVCIVFQERDWDAQLGSCLVENESSIFGKIVVQN